MEKMRRAGLRGLVAVLALAGMAFAAGETRKQLHFKVGTHPMVSINNPYGPILVKGGPEHEVSVVAVLHSKKVELDQGQSGNRVSIVSHLLPGADATTGIVDYEVTVPVNASLSLHSDTGR